MAIDNELEHELCNSSLTPGGLVTAEQFDRHRICSTSEDARMFYICNVGIDLQLYYDRQAREVSSPSPPEDLPSAAATNEVNSIFDFDDDLMDALAEAPPAPAPRPDPAPAYIFVDETPDRAGTMESLLSRWWRMERIAEVACSALFFVALLVMLCFSSFVAPEHGSRAKKLVGRITNLADCRWGSGSQPMSFYDPVAIGQKIHLTAGLLEIRYETGAVAVLQGPVVYEISSENGGFLARAMIGKVTEGPRGFAVKRRRSLWSIWGPRPESRWDCRKDHLRLQRGQADGRCRAANQSPLP